MIHNYETVLVLSPDLDEAALNVEVKKVEEIITSNKGKIISRDNWGSRELAYKIQKKTHGFYVLVVFEAEAGVVGEIDRALGINDNFLRHLCVKKDKHAPDRAARVAEEEEKDREEAAAAALAEAEAAKSGDRRPAHQS